MDSWPPSGAPDVESRGSNSGRTSAAQLGHNMAVRVLVFTLAACASAAEEQSAPKKQCSSSLKGDYQFEACGAFCKEAKKGNHCKCARPRLLLSHRRTAEHRRPVVVAGFANARRARFAGALRHRHR